MTSTKLAYGKPNMKEEGWVQNYLLSFSDQDVRLEINT